MSTPYHIFYSDLLNFSLPNNFIESLELQYDFYCESCRELLKQICCDTSKTYCQLTNFVLTIVNHQESSTVGIFVHLLKQIFKIDTLQSFKLNNVPNFIFQELLTWFHPDKISFSQIRSFQLKIDSDSEFFEYNWLKFIFD